MHKIMSSVFDTLMGTWAAIRLKNSSTLIAGEADSLTREVNPKREAVWEVNTKKDLPLECQFSPAPRRY